MKFLLIRARWEFPELFFLNQGKEKRTGQGILGCKSWLQRIQRAMSSGQVGATNCTLAPKPENRDEGWGNEGDFLKWLPRRHLRVATPRPFISVNKSAKLHMGWAAPLQEPLPQSGDFFLTAATCDFPAPHLPAGEVCALPKSWRVYQMNKQTANSFWRVFPVSWQLKDGSCRTVKLGIWPF